MTLIRTGFTVAHSTLRPHQAAALRSLIDDGFKVNDCHSSSYNAAKDVAFVDPINGDPCVIDLGAGTVWTYIGVPANSGTAHLRARIEAQRIYESITRG